MDNQNYNVTNDVPQNSGADMSVGDWIITLILTAIPFIGLICLIVWAVSSSPEKRSRKNWAIAQFIMVVIAIVIAIIFVSCVGVSAASMMSNY